MDLAPPPLQMPRIRHGWPLAAARPAASDAAKQAEVARQFETIIAETLLRSARAASLGDDGLGGDGGSENVRAMIDHARAEAIARAAPMGVARLLANPAPSQPQ
jgi:Rod binding domain-containing protein